MGTDTGYTLDQFLADTRTTIKTKGVPSGLAEIRDHLEKLLRNPELLKKHLGDPVPYRERTTIGHVVDAARRQGLRRDGRSVVGHDALQCQHCTAPESTAPDSVAAARGRLVFNAREPGGTGAGRRPGAPSSRHRAAR